MAVAKVERLLVLMNVLLGAATPVSAVELHRRVPGYPEEDASFRRAFERDKEEIREMGVPLLVEPIAGTDPPLVGYRIRPQDYALADPGLRRLGEVVHDLDLKDGKYARPETAGLERLLAGLFLLTDDDEQRLRQGGALFETLHRSYQQEPP